MLIELVAKLYTILFDIRTFFCYGMASNAITHMQSVADKFFRSLKYDDSQ